MSEIIHTQAYQQLKQSATQRVRLGQTVAISAVNTQQFMLYWDLGKMIVDKQAEHKWGKSVVEQLSVDLQKEFEGMRGLSATNLWRMRAFYLAYTQDTILPPAVGELKTPNNNALPLALTHIAWSHNCIIVEKCKTLHQRMYYIAQAQNNGWSKNVLIHQIENQNYEKTVVNQSNFENTLISRKANKADLSLKDDYTFDFLELTEKHSEYQLEQAILNNIRRFLIEMGGDFTYMGNQYNISLEGKDYKIDLLLYHRSLQALVAIELKVTEFMPEYAGKMNFYLSLLNEKVKKAHENPSIGIIICKSKERTTVEFALKDVNKPIGVATYSLSQQLPIELRDFFPTAKELEQRVELVADINQQKHKNE